MIKAKKVFKEKGWYVDLGLKHRKCFSGQGWKWRARIFPTKKLAREAFPDPVVPVRCVITFKLPN